MVDQPLEIGQNIRDIVLDITYPRAITVRAVNTQTHASKFYILKITPKSGVVLV